jgi:hypothetical protein
MVAPPPTFASHCGRGQFDEATLGILDFVAGPDAHGFTPPQNRHSKIVETLKGLIVALGFDCG